MWRRITLGAGCTIMRYLDRGAEPQSWVDFKRRNKKVRYSDLDTTPDGRAVRQQMRAHLVSSQNGLCAYCCARIGAGSDSSLTEHIKPESRFPNETMDYSNLIASCVRKDSCGIAKGSEYSQQFVSPLQPDCAEHFRFYPDGSVVGVDERGKVTCDLLQLDCYPLRSARRAMIESLAWADADYVRDYYIAPDKDGNCEQFADMLEQLCDRGFFSDPVDSATDG